MLFVAWLYRQIFECCRRVDNFLFSPPKKSRHIHASDLPWLWVGAVHGENDVEDVTELVNSIVTWGDVVNKEWLDSILNTKPVLWRYLDTLTLEEKEIPSEGFVIENDPLVADSEDDVIN